MENRHGSRVVAVVVVTMLGACGLLAWRLGVDDMRELSQGVRGTVVVDRCDLSRVGRHGSEYTCVGDFTSDLGDVHIPDVTFTDNSDHRLGSTVPAVVSGPHARTADVEVLSRRGLWLFIPACIAAVLAALLGTYAFRAVRRRGRAGEPPPDRADGRSGSGNAPAASPGGSDMGLVVAATFVQPRGSIRATAAGRAPGSAGALSATPDNPTAAMGSLGYLAVFADRIVLFQARPGAFWPAPTAKQVASVPMSAVASAQVLRGVIAGVLEISFVDRPAWRFDVTGVHLRRARKAATVLSISNR